MKMKNTQLESLITRLVLHDAIDWLKPNYVPNYMYIIRKTEYYSYLSFIDLY